MKYLTILLIPSLIFTADFTNNGATLIIDSAVTITMTGSFENNGAVNHSGYLSVSGDIMNAGTFSADFSSTILLNGSDQSFPGLNFGNLIIDGDGTKTMLGDVIVSSDFILNNGILDLNNHTLSILGDIQYNGGGIFGNGSVIHNGINIYGCTDELAENFNPDFIFDDGSCTYDFSGCTDPTAYNYNMNATVDDGSCVYTGDVDQNGSVNVADVVLMVNFVLGLEAPSPDELALGDVVPNGQIDIVDVVMVISWILGSDLQNAAPVTHARLTMNDGVLSLQSNGSVAGIQIDFQGDFTVTQSFLPDGWMMQSGVDRMILLSLDGYPLNGETLFEYSGEFTIISVLTADWLGSSVTAEVNIAPDQFSLSPAYPNPFNPITTFTFGVPEPSRVIIRVYDLKGQMVAELVNGFVDGGFHQVTWDASNKSSGMYLLNMRAPGFNQSIKVVVLK